MAQSKSKKASVKPAPKKRRRSGALNRNINRALRFVARVNWPSVTLRAAALIALVAVGIAVSITVGTHAGDMITAVILVCTAILAELGIVLGPQVLHKVRGAARFWTKVTIGLCIALAAWNLSTSLHNADVAQASAAARAADTYEDDLARLNSLNRRIDGLADETGGYGAAAQSASAAYENTLAERDLIQARIDRATAEPVMFSTNLLFWMKAGFFHGMVFLFSAFFSIPMKAKSNRRAAGSKSASKAPRGDPNWAAANF
ncbi:MAG TPA: hypothetical protein VM915_09690 [Verrucomicrobiae bacterium]|nr:hypothetical protein [Verrucomicrobiae bacterium]